MVNELQDNLEALDELNSSKEAKEGLSFSEKQQRKKMKKISEAAEKPIVATEKGVGKSADIPDGPVGLDIGTSHIIVAQNKKTHIDSVKQLNAFFKIPKSKFAKDILAKNEVLYYELDNLFYIVGYSADNFAKMFNTNTNRPIQKGILSSDEKEGMGVIKAVMLSLIKKPKKFGETLCFGVPGEPIDGTGSIVYHKSILTQFLGKLGYAPLSINEAMAVVLSELADDDYTGIGISLGGGMCNVCLSYLSFPVITYSIQKAGDYIDSMVGVSVGEPSTKVKIIKEKEFSYKKPSSDRVLTAIQIFYDDLINNLLKSMQDVLSSTDKIPMISKPIPIVLSGGTAMPDGFVERFEKLMKKYTLPVEISSVRLSDDPLNATAKGALIMAMTES